MKMRKANRSIALFLALALLCGMAVTVHAEVATLGIYFCGKRTSDDGSVTVVKLEGRFRVTQNGEDVGIIQAGKETLTLNSTERVRIVPLPESISPEWDLSNAACAVELAAGGTTTVPIVVEPMKADVAPTAAPVPETTPEPVPTPAPEYDPDMMPDDMTDDTTGDMTYEPDDGTEEEQYIASSGPVTTPTLPPFDPSLTAPTPEPAWVALPVGSGRVHVMAYLDQNNNGLAQDSDRPVSGVTVCLFTENDEAVASGRTGDDGTVLFENLPAERYRIKAILPDGVAFNRRSQEAEPYASVFASSIEGEAMSDLFDVYEEGVTKPGISLAKCIHVSGTCWFDEVGDGLFKDGEPLLGGVRIELNGEKNGLHYETISGEDGTWRIDRVSPAAYRLTAHAPDGMMFAKVSKVGGRRSVITKDGVGTASRRIDLNDNESKEKMYIGFAWSGVIHGRAFLDANYNGIYDEGEMPMAGVKVTAIKQAKDEEAAVTYTAEDGTYTLVGLRGNTYKMRAVLPQDGSDFTKTVSDPLGNHFESRPGRRENFWPNFILADAEHREMNVGVIYPASITGTVYMDNDFSGTLNNKEKIVTSFLVKLLDEQGNTVVMDKTSVKGKYELTRVPPGNYSLSVTAVKDYAFTRLGEGNVILNRTNGEGYSETFTLGLGENRTGMDIGMIKPGTVQGSVFADRNDNGIRDAGENGLNGVVVRLMNEEGEAFRADIGENGSYLFDAVMPGTYWIEYDLPDNAIFAQTASGGNTISGDRTGCSESFQMTSGTVREGPLCGALTLGRIDGTAYMDHDGDGFRSEGEELAAGVTVRLTPSRGDLDEISVTTGDDGSFALTGLHPDNWTLTVDCPESHVLSRTDSLSLPLTAGKASQSVSLPVSMGAVWAGQGLGTVIPAAVSGQLWLDENNNGLFDAGELTPAGYEVTVTDDRTGRVFDTLRTDGEGRFATSGMIPGSFTLSFPLDADTIAPKNGNSDFQEAGDRLVLSGIVLGENEHKDGLLLGIVRYTSIGGGVWIDRGGSVETLSGAQITLKDGDGNELRTLTTGGDGSYKFDKLMPGTYRLEAVMPEGCVIIEPEDPRLSGDLISVMTETVNRNGSSEPIELQMANDQMQMHIGCVLPGRIGDFCWLDLDKDGLQGMDEPGIPNVRVELLRDGVKVAETVTDQYGFYRINDLYPASYTLRVTAPTEVKPTTHRTDIPMICSVLEATDDTVSESADIHVESDKANYNADLGFVCRKDGIMPAGTGAGKTQVWSDAKNTDD